ncbi:MAG: DsbC family protein [Xanthomonadales bacterium]|nr:DsbC family protein [Xanthomonadales bacterium]
MNTVNAVALTGALILAQSAAAQTTPGPDDDAAVRAAISSLVPNASIDSIADSPLPGVLEVVVNGNVVYFSADGKILIQGSLYDVAGRRDLTEQRRATLRVSGLEEAGPERRIIFAPEHPKHSVTVFTDIDCGYCRRMHQEIAQYNELGIAVEYLFFPRAGVGSDSFDKAVTVWCSDDRRKALTDAKSGVALDKKSCPNPIEDDFKLGSRLGVGGTPAVFNADGVQLGGYVPPQQLLQRLDQLAAQSKN